MEKIRLEIQNLSPSQLQVGSFTLVLAEAAGEKRLPIIIGLYEAQAIAIEMEQLKPSRPLTHDLFKSFSKAFDFSIEEINIYDMQEGVFYSKIICSDGIRQKSIDARPSDAVAIALRFNAPIYTNTKVLEVAGISPSDTSDAEQESKASSPIPVRTPNNLAHFSADELNKMLNEAISKEEYERAATIRDEIEKRN